MRSRFRCTNCRRTLSFYAFAEGVDVAFGVSALDVLASGDVLFVEEVKCRCKTLNTVAVRDCRYEARPPRTSDHPVVYPARDSNESPS